MDKLICIDCGEIFSKPRHYTETHNLSTPPYEEWDGCPCCGGVYTKVRTCDECGEWIIGEYVKLKSGERFCENCYTEYELGDED